MNHDVAESTARFLTRLQTLSALGGSMIGVISGIIHVLKIGCRWQDCPAEHGPSTTVYNRFNRWSRLRFWLKLLEASAGSGAVTRSTSIDSTYVKAQRSAFGGKGAPDAGYRPIAQQPDDQSSRPH